MWEERKAIARYEPGRWDITDDDEARWLEACVWPDQTDRFERLKATIEMARDIYGKVEKRVETIERPRTVEPEPIAARVNEFLGGTLDQQGMLSAIDKNLYRQRKAALA